MGLRHERLTNRLAGRGPNLRATFRDVVAHRRVRQVAHLVLIGQPRQHPPRGVALLARRGQVDGQHRVDQRLGRVQLRGRPHRDLPNRRDRVSKCLPDRAPMHAMPVRQRPNRQTITPMITTYRLEQLHSRPRHFRPFPIAVNNTTSLRGGARSNRHNRDPGVSEVGPKQTVTVGPNQTDRATRRASSPPRRRRKAQDRTAVLTLSSMPRNPDAAHPHRRPRRRRS